MPVMDTWLVARGGAASPPGGLFIDGTAEHGAAFLAAMPGCEASASVRPRRGRRGPGWSFASASVPLKAGGIVWGSVSVELAAAAIAGGGDEKESLLGGRKARADVVETEGNAAAVVEDEERRRRAGAGAMNTAKHLWAGAVAAMVSSSFGGTTQMQLKRYVDK